MPKIAAPKKPKRPTRRAVWCARVNLFNFTNPEWVRKGGWTSEHVAKVIKESEEVLATEKLYL